MDGESPASTTSDAVKNPQQSRPPAATSTPNQRTEEETKVVVLPRPSPSTTGSSTAVATESDSQLKRPVPANPQNTLRNTLNLQALNREALAPSKTHQNKSGYGGG